MGCPSHLPGVPEDYQIVYYEHAVSMLFACLIVSRPAVSTTLLVWDNFFVFLGFFELEINEVDKIIF